MSLSAACDIKVSYADPGATRHADVVDEQWLPVFGWCGQRQRLRQGPYEQHRALALPPPARESGPGVAFRVTSHGETVVRVDPGTSLQCGDSRE